jgi:hypothetical protein
MGNVIAKSVYILVTLCVMLVLANFSTFESYFSHHQVTCAMECPGTSGQAEQSHPDCPGDEVFASNTNTKTGLLTNPIILFQALSDPLSNNYYANIWQPPRFL